MVRRHQHSYLGGHTHQTLFPPENCGSHALTGDGVGDAASLLHGRVVVALVAGDDSHHHLSPVGDDLLDRLDVGRRVVVGHLVDLRLLDQHPDAGCHFSQLVDEPGGQILVLAVPANILCKTENKKIFIKIADFGVCNVIGITY